MGWLFGVAMAACGGPRVPPGPPPPLAAVRLGHFPTLTHAPGLVAHALSRAGEGVFERHLGPGVAVTWQVFQAGPSAMEAILTGALDATYVGPSPAYNAYARTQGDEVRVLAAAVTGGSALVVRRAAGITEPAQLRGRMVATPQLGNTQDVACRAFLQSLGLRVTLTGGDVRVVPIEAPSQLAMFQAGTLDAAWAVEPWVSRLLREGGGVVLHEEPHAVTTLLVARAAFVAAYPEAVVALRAAHRELLGICRDAAPRARELAARELQTLTGRPVAAELVASCWRRLSFGERIDAGTFARYLVDARAAGLLRQTPEPDRLVLPEPMEQPR